MRLVFVFLLSLVAILATPDVKAGWGTGQCRQLPAEPTVAWFTAPNDSDWLYLFRGDEQIGAYSLKDRYYRSYNASVDQWGPKESDPPLSLPVQYQQRQIEAVPNYGVETEKLGNGERYWVNKARQFFGDTLPDDKNRIRLTIAGGTDDERKKVLADLASSPQLAPYRDGLLVQAYEADNWALRPGFVTSGHPTIYLQAPDGKVLHRQDDYSDGATGLATAIRKANPQYDAKKDQDLRRPVIITPSLDISKLPAPVWAIVGGITVLLLRKGS